MWVQIDRWKCISDIPEKRILLHFLMHQMGLFSTFFNSVALFRCLVDSVDPKYGRSISECERAGCVARHAKSLE